MQYPRYEFVIPRDSERTPNRRHPRPRVARPTPRVRPRLRALVSRREPRPLLEIHEYLELEFTVDERR